MVGAKNGISGGVLSVGVALDGTGLGVFVYVIEAQ